MQHTVLNSWNHDFVRSQVTFFEIWTEASPDSFDFTNITWVLSSGTWLLSTETESLSQSETDYKALSLNNSFRILPYKFIDNGPVLLLSLPPNTLLGNKRTDINPVIILLFPGAVYFSVLQL